MGVIFFSIDAATFDILKNADRSLIALAALLVVCGWCLDSMKFMLLARAAGERLPFKLSISLVWINYFGSAITPMQSGGGPFQIYLLYRHGVSVGKSIAITLVRTLQVLFLLALTVPFALMAEPEFAKEHCMMIWVVGYVMLFIVVAGFLLVVSVVRPQWIKRWSSGFLVRIRRFGFIRPRKLVKAARWVNAEIDCYNANIKLFLSAGRKWLFLSLLVALVNLWVYLSIMPCLIKALGFEVQYFECILAEALLIFLLYFVPTPGGSGIAEGGAAAVFAIFVPWNLAGIMGVIWRMLSEYSGVALGTGIALRLLGWGGAEEVMSVEDGVSADESQ